MLQSNTSNPILVTQVKLGGTSYEAKYIGATQFQTARELTLTEQGNYPTANSFVQWISSEGTGVTMDGYFEETHTSIATTADNAILLTLTSGLECYFAVGHIVQNKMLTSGTGTVFQVAMREGGSGSNVYVQESLSAVAAAIFAKATSSLPATVMLTSQNNTMSGTFGVRFGAATESINSSVAGQLDIDAGTEVEITSTALDINAATTDISGITVNSGIDTRTDAGAVSVTGAITQVRTTAPSAITLANGANGQVKEIVMTADGGDATLTPATKTGFTTITFNDIGDTVVLRFYTSLGWMVVSNYGCTIA